MAKYAEMWNVDLTTIASFGDDTDCLSSTSSPFRKHFHWLLYSFNWPSSNPLRNPGGATCAGPPVISSCTQSPLRAPSGNAFSNAAASASSSCRPPGRKGRLLMLPLTKSFAGPGIRGAKPPAPEPNTSPISICTDSGSHTCDSDKDCDVPRPRRKGGCQAGARMVRGAEGSSGGLASANQSTSHTLPTSAAVGRWSSGLR